jgi:hypothetical protein
MKLEVSILQTHFTFQRSNAVTNQGNPGKGRPLPEPPRRPTQEPPRNDPSRKGDTPFHEHVEPEKPWDRPKK